MRKLKLQVQLSADGFIGGPNGEMDWMTINWDNELKDYVKALTEPVDCILLGRKLAEGFIPYWASRPATEDDWGIDKYIYTPKVVFTKTLAHSPWERTVLAKGDLVEEVNRLKKQEGGDLIVYGGATYVSALIREGLIDEYHLFVNPMAIGRGLSIFGALQAYQKLVLVRSKVFDCGILELFYKRAQ